MKRILFLINIYSGKSEIKNHIADIIDLYNKKGCEVTVYISQYSGNMSDIIKKCGEEYDAIVCSGGDGTLNEVTAAVLSLKKQPVIGYIPCGSTNDFANSIGIPKSPLDAAEIAVDGKPFEIDLGVMEGRSFVYVAAFGAFTNVSYETPQNLKNVLGYQAYVLEGIKQIASIKTYHMVVEWDDGNCLAGDFLLGFVSNTRSIAGIKISTIDNIEFDDGLLEVLLIANAANPITARKILKGIVKRDYSDPNAIYSFKAKHIKFVCSEPIDWTIDGEHGGTYKTAEISVVNKAIKINVPEEE